MPFQPIDYAHIEPMGNPFWRNLGPNMMNSFKQGYELSQMPGEYKRKAEAEELANQLSRLKSQQEPQQFQADLLAKQLSNSASQYSQSPEQLQRQKEAEDINNRYKAQLTDSSIQKTPGEVAQQNLSNAFQSLVNKGYPAKEAMDLAVKQSQINLNNMGGKGGPAGTKYQQAYEMNVGKDNPQLKTYEQIREAANLLSTVPPGTGVTLSDGTQVKPLTQASRSALDQVAKAGSTTEILNSSIKGERAESELPVIADYIKKGNSVYPTDLFGFSIAKAKDEASAAQGDKPAINRLAQSTASQILSYEQSQLQQLLASGKTTVQATKEITKYTERHLKSLGINSADVRNKVLDIVNEATKKAFEARKSVYGGASSILPNKAKKEESSSNGPPPGARIRKWEDL